MTLDYLDMQAVLRAYYLNVDVDTRLLDAAIQRKPHLEAEAAEWGWDDTDVRENLLTAVCEALGIEWPTGQDPEENIAMQDVFERAHGKWVAAHA